jgi:hypothetical protein
MSNRTFRANVRSASATTQDSDWISRSTEPGVVWAHDFRDPNEVRAWRYTPSLGTANTQPDHILDVQRNATSGIGSSGMMVHTIRGTTLAQNLDATSTTVYLTSVAEFPDPALAVGGVAGTGRYYALMGSNALTSEQVIVTGINRNDNSLTIIRSPSAQRQPHDAGGGFSVQDQTAWWRYMGAFGVENGKTTPDVGIANGFKNFDTDFTTMTVSRNYGRMRGCYWGHSDYEALYDATWPISGYDAASTAAGRVWHDTFVGTEFWIQWRAKIAGDRMANPDGKMCYLQAVTATPHQFFTNISPETSKGQRLNFVNDGQGRIIDLCGKTLTQPYTPYMTEVSTYQCRLNEWVTYMIHVRPGRFQVFESVVDLYVQEPEDTAWRHIISTSNLDMAYYMPASNRPHPPAYNIFSVLNYANHYEGGGSVGASSSTHSIQATQVILSSQEIPLPLPLV